MISIEQALPKTRSQRYELLGRLGRGGMAEVHRAYDTWLDRIVAFKQVREPNESQNAAMVRESHALAWLRHPNIVSMLDVTFENGVPCLVLEYVPGLDIGQVVRRKMFDVADFEKVALQILSALATVHAAGWVHGDVKPGNIMLECAQQPEWTAKLLDFGLSGAPGDAGVGSSGPSRDDHGSIYFLAPERFDGQVASMASDIYALGAVFYYLLSGQCPVSGANDIEVMAGHILGRITPLREVAQVPAFVSDLVMAMLNTDPMARPTAAEAWHAIDDRRLAAASSPEIARSLGVSM